MRWKILIFVTGPVLKQVGMFSVMLNPIEVYYLLIFDRDFIFTFCIWE